MSNDKLAEALRDATFVAAMLEAICETDGTVDRMRARDAAFRVRDALQAHAAEAAQPQAQNSEWVMVPREPTQAMLDANGDCDFPEGKAWLEKDARTTWAAMLAAVENKS